MIGLLGALLLAHMVADYPLQTNRMAKDKHDDRGALATHSFVHGVVAFFSIWGFVGIGFAAALAIPVAFVHGAIDGHDLSIRWDQTAHLTMCVLISLFTL